MAREADPSLESRILDAAARLWVKGGDKALTMRAVARAARTTTPTIYQRFKNREDILLALLKRFQKARVGTIAASRSPIEVFQQYIQYALDNPREYELVFGRLFKAASQDHRGLMTVQEHRPALELLKSKMADWLGGSPEDQTGLCLGLWALAHGACMLQSSKAVPDDLSPDLLRACEAAANLLLENAPAFQASTIGREKWK